MGPRIGVCSWSLQPESCGDLVKKLAACSTQVVQLALDPLRVGAWDPEETRRLLDEARVTVISGMMGMKGEDYSSLESIRRTGGVALDENWEENLIAAQETAVLARRFGLSLVTLHAGFIPEAAENPPRMIMLDRLRLVARTFQEEGVTVGLETGQETAETLLEVLAELDTRTVGVNFDPANMILYGMGDPVESLRRLAPHVCQMHVKDALPAAVPGEWGTEVPVGEGAVDWQALFKTFSDGGLGCDLVVEREAGDTRVGDVQKATTIVKGYFS